MNLADLLEYTAKQFLDDRTELVDGDGDDLWSDSFLVRQLNEAQRLLARRSWCIIETGKAPAGRVTLITDVSLYLLHKSVLRVFDATPTTQSLPLGRSEDIQLRNTALLSQNPFDAFDAYEIGEAASLAGNVTNTAGPPLAIATDAGFREMRVFPPPTSVQNGLVISLKIARLPITWLSLDKPDGVPEIPDDYHLALCSYAAGKALTQPNVDGQQKETGRELLREFNDACKEARQDRQRLGMGPARWAFSSTTAVLR